MIDNYLTPIERLEKVIAEMDENGLPVPTEVRESLANKKQLSVARQQELLAQLRSDKW